MEFGKAVYLLLGDVPPYIRNRRSICTPMRFLPLLSSGALIPTNLLYYFYHKDPMAQPLTSFEAPFVTISDDSPRTSSLPPYPSLRSVLADSPCSEQLGYLDRELELVRYNRER